MEWKSRQEGLPEGPFRRLWAEFEVEVTDVEALRAFDVHPMGDGEGNIVGLVDMDDDERLGWAVTRAMHAALQILADNAGVKFVAGTGPRVRQRTKSGTWAEWGVPEWPFRLADGTEILPEGWPEMPGASE